ncbi:hypothetical protein [Desulfobulbus oligotrophicus]|jgi:hypothetical protein|uniref:Uncharacterized protein n=1 Tax=Desulfobulbus oligotrophicus TaxID=1909699 RepID=A0A7T5VEG2_9BACT|nr:hypothetical protein [Desulfobulbus oligotrophicus]MDY0390215.1 hypothetical protein [Desulfobulbus oligotrophicus]QQG66286.1 hypothetical protein HP555_10645 [Desulfobulbus oligotrophicus]
MTSTAKPATIINYDILEDLALFLEQYDQLTHEIQQAQVQLDSSPALDPGSPGYEKREEWRTWLHIQIQSKQKAREKLVTALRDQHIQIENLPE